MGILKAYSATGLQPRTDVFYVEDGCACAVGVVWAKLTGNRNARGKANKYSTGRNSPDRVFRNRFGVDQRFVSDLIYAFDKGFWTLNSDGYRDGFLVGMVVREALGFNG